MHQSLPRATDGGRADEIALRCAETAGALIRAAVLPSALTKSLTSGGRADLVTETDGAVERAVVTILAAAYPRHGIVGEETGVHAADSPWVWVIDPVDGTRNFSQGLPLFAFNLALYHADTPMLAVTLDPIHNETFFAEVGEPTTLNGTAVRVRDTHRLADGLLGIDLGLSDGRAAAMITALGGLFPGVQGVRLVGSTALGLAWVAAGRLDAYVHPSPYAWDFAPGALLVQQAGGSVTDLSGAPLTLHSRSVVAGSAGVQAEAQRAFQRASELEV